MVKSVKRILVMLFFIIVAMHVIAEEEGNKPSFGASLGLGIETINGQAWQTLSFVPDLAFGPFGVGLDATIHYTFTGGETGTEFQISMIDWVPKEAGLTFLELYLPKIRYVRWGVKGEPLYVKFGGIDDGTLGNGFVFGNYSNTLFLPEEKILGLAFDLSGDLFKFPYVGIETLVGNLAAPDVLGFRAFLRPLNWLSIPIIKNLELGYTMGMDLNVYSRVTADPPPEAVALGVTGFDFRLPVLGSSLLSLALFGDYAILNLGEGYKGGMIGFGGKLLNLITYGAQLRIIGENFRPVYFNQGYDIEKANRYDELLASALSPVPSFIGAFATAGTSLLGDKIILNASVDFPLEQVVPEMEGNPPHELNYPHLRGVFIVSEGIVPGFSASASYDKKFITSFADLIDPMGAIIKARINYGSGPATISMVYNLRYDPESNSDEPWVVTSGLESSIKLF